MTRRVLILALACGIASAAGCSGQSSAVPACSAAETTLVIGEPTFDGSQFHTSLVVTNHRTGACAMWRHPAVRLFDDAAGATRPFIWIIGDSNGVESDVTVVPEVFIVPPSGQVAAPLTFLDGPDPGCDRHGPWLPTRLVVTIGEGVELDGAWTAGSVDDCQEGATYPGTFVGSFDSVA